MRTSQLILAACAGLTAVCNGAALPAPFPEAKACPAASPIAAEAGSVTADTTSQVEDLATSYADKLGSACACGILKIVKNGMLFYPGSTTYETESNWFYTDRELLNPACVFVPSTAADVAVGVLTARVCKSKFSVRGAGHMPVKGAANIDGGILFVNSKFKKIQISSDRTSVNVGPGVTWIDVVRYLEPYGKVVIGGRLKSIGVPGLTLGGGIHYLGAKYGFACDNVNSYQIVLSTGQVVTASATTNRELYWALKGSSNNFGIVTNFNLALKDAPSVASQVQLWGPQAGIEFSNAVADLAMYQDQIDTAAGGIFTIGSYPGIGLVERFVGVQVGKTVKPAVFANFTQIANPFQAVYNVSTFRAFAETQDSGAYGGRWRYMTHAVVASRSALTYMYNDFSAALPLMANVTGFSPTLVFQPITKGHLKVAATNGIGNALGTDPSVNQIWYALTLGWGLASDDATVFAWQETLINRWHAKFTSLGTARSTIYMNDAADTQRVIASYGTSNVARLKAASRVYDPSGTFQTLCHM